MSHALSDRSASRARRYTLEPEAENTIFDTGIEWLMGALLVFAPLAFGATEAWAQEVIFVLVAAMLLLLCAKLMSDRAVSFAWSWTYLPIGFFLSLVAFQLVPLPAAVLKAIAPGTIATRANLLRDLPSATSGRQTVTLYPYVTSEQLRLLVSVVGMFVVVLNIYREPARIRRLLMTIAGVGAAVALLAIYQNISGSEMIYGIARADHPNSGPFMNYSHFGQFMNLSIGAAFGAALVKITEVARRHRTSQGTLDELRQPSSWQIWALLALCAVGPITIFLSMTRMGMISMLAAGAFTTAMLCWRAQSRGRESLVLGISICVLALLLIAGFDAVYDRLATLRHLEIANGGRLQMLRDMLSEFRLFPIVGTGLGTHEFVFPMFDHSTIAQIATHAENEYAQLMEECGAVGLGCALLFLALIVGSYFRAIWRPKNPPDYAAYGLGFGLLAILIHSGSDFGQHVPANALLTAAFSAILLNLAGKPWMRPRADELTRAAIFNISLFSVARGLAGMAILVLIVAWALPQDEHARQAEVAWNQAQLAANSLQANQWQGSNDDYLDLLKSATAASQLEPGNVVYRYHLNEYRWRSLSRNLDPKTGRVILPAIAVKFAARIVDDLQAIRAMCPTYGPSQCLAGQLRLFVLKDPKGADQIAAAFQLAPDNPSVCLIEGKLAAHQGRWDDSLTALRKCAALGTDAHEIVQTYLEVDRPALAYEFAAGNRQNLQYLSAVLVQEHQDLPLAARCDREANALLVQAAQNPDAPAELVAQMAAYLAQQGKVKDAIEYYERALSDDYGQIDWRLQLASELASAGQVANAMREARICLRLHPESAAAQAMVANLSVKDGADDQSADASRAAASMDPDGAQ